MVNYNEAVVYKLCCKDVTIKEEYVGSTCCFKKRKSQHKTSCNNENMKEYKIYVYQFIRENGGFENWDMIQIEKCSVKTKRELEMRERFYIESLGASLNKKTPTRTRKEYREAHKEHIAEKGKVYREANKEHIADHDKKYYEANKEQFAERGKVYYEANKEQIAEKSKVYREANKEHIAKRHAIKIQCDCGLTITQTHLSRHKKSLKHKAYEATLNPI